MKIQRLILVLTFSFGFALSTFASNNPVKKEILVPNIEKQELAASEAAIDEFDKSVEIWVIPVPTAAEYKYKEGIAA